MLNFQVLDKNFYVELDKDAFKGLLLIPVEDKKVIQPVHPMTVSEAFEIAKRGENEFDCEGSAKAAWALDTILKELGKELNSFLNIALIHVGDKNPIMYYGTNEATKEQYRLANVVLGFEKGKDDEDETWVEGMRKLLIDYSAR